jgi:hypothetical protein
MHAGDVGADMEERISADCLTVHPVEARLDASSLCQLDCPLCPVAQRRGRPFIGRGLLPFHDFREFIDCNHQIRTIELGNSGEVFLNPHLPAMLQYAFEKGVSTRIAEGANLNYATDEALEALVRYGVTVLRVAIDGVTQETYKIYRVGGDLKKVLGNVQKINACKKQYGSTQPHLILQFILFGHNEQEMKKAAILAKALGMELDLRLNVFTGLLPLQNPASLTEQLGYCDKNSYFQITGKVYMRDICFQLWRSPQINWDGRLLGCSANSSFSYAENALDSKFTGEINNAHIQYARKMLMGLAPPREDIPCSACDSFANYKKFDQWFTPEEIKTAMERGQ